jgi:hypothetical protein
MPSSPPITGVADGALRKHTRIFLYAAMSSLGTHGLLQLPHASLSRCEWSRLSWRESDPGGCYCSYLQGLSVWLFERTPCEQAS